MDQRGTASSAPGKVMLSHRSIRRYKPDAVPQSLLDEILEAGVRASSSGNMQTFSVVVSRSAVAREKLCALHFDQEMVRQAPVLLTFCSDFHRMRRWLALNRAPDNFDNLMSFMIGTIDAVLVCQNVVLAAEERGLGVCFLGTTLANCEGIADLLRLPANVIPVTGIVLGYPDEEVSLRDRLPVQGLVHEEAYQDYDDTAIQEIYRSRELEGWKRYCSNARLAALIEASGVENLAQVYTRLKYTRQSHVGYSKNLLACLKKRGFFNHDDEA